MPQAPASGLLLANAEYLKECGERWHGSGETGAGWDLVRALRSRNPDSRAIAGGLLAKTPHFRLFPASSVETRCESGTIRPACMLGQEPQEVGMNTPYGLAIVENCNDCKLRKEGSFCNVTPGMLKSLSSASHQCTYPGGAVLFVEGQTPRGAFILCHGRVKLSTTSRDGKVLILKIAQAGEILGLSAVISSCAYELTAETSGPCQVNFLEREPFMRMLASSGELGMRSAQALSRDFQSAHRDIHDLVLARSSAGKLARLLLSWTEEDQKTDREIRIRSGLTHEEMAQMIGSSRETVTRLLSDLKKKQFIRLEGSVLVIRNKVALEALAN
jgi:CRP/FNR family transcriptional regulator